MKKLLIIEHDKHISNEIEKDLLKEFYVLKAINEDNVLEILEENEIDLILLDINMPIENGFKIGRLIKRNKDYNQIPIIFLSDKEDKEITIKCLKIGAKDYIVSPINYQELKFKINNHIKTYIYHRKIKEQKEFIEIILNKQDNLVFLISKGSLKFMNKRASEFFNINNASDFNLKCNSLPAQFRKLKGCFLPKGVNWVKELNNLSCEQRVVAIKNKYKEIKIFKVSIETYHDYNHIITLTDITLNFIKQNNMEDELNKDSLTKSLNRRFFENNIYEIIRKNKKHNLETGVAILDIDDFKQINDKYGHPAGDETLVNLVDLIKSNTRKIDFIIRWGGEEFILLIAAKDISDFYKVLEHLREKIANHHFKEVKHVTASFGAIIFQSHLTPDDCIIMADKCLYEAKNRGKNKVIFV